MALTTEEKKEIKQAVLDEIKAQSSDITEIENASSIDGITSMPVLQGTKLVKVPITQLAKYIAVDGGIIIE